MEASKTSSESKANAPTSQVQPLAAAPGLDSPDIKWENLDSGLVWGVRHDHIEKASLPDPVVNLFKEQDGA
jgi:hypothetical protein